MIPIFHVSKDEMLGWWLKKRQWVDDILLFILYLVCRSAPTGEMKCKRKTGGVKSENKTKILSVSRAKIQPSIS